MEEIRVGEYVRLDRNQGINRIEDVEKDDEDDTNIRYELENIIWDEYANESWYIENTDEILKHSENIFDVLEVGDIVEVEDMGDNRIIHINDDRYLEDFKGYVANGYFKIKSIITHEQMDSMKYIVGGEEE